MMKNMDIQPITSEPAPFISKIKLLVIADLHIGIERELREGGLQVPSQTNKMTTRLQTLIKKCKPSDIVIVGDVKHNIPTSTYQERHDVLHFLETIESTSRVHILPGNHDGNIANLVSSDTQVHPSDGCIIRDIGFIHGHRWPNPEIMQGKHVVIAHTHPTVELTDRLGHKTYEPCWLRGQSRSDIEKRYPKASGIEFIVLPPFNPLCGGIPVNTEKMIGPFRKILDIPNLDVHLLDGSFLGKVKDIN